MGCDCRADKLREIDWADKLREIDPCVEPMQGGGGYYITRRYQYVGGGGRHGEYVDAPPSETVYSGTQPHLTELCDAYLTLQRVILSMVRVCPHCGRALVAIPGPTVQDLTEGGKKICGRP